MPLFGLRNHFIRSIKKNHFDYVHMYVINKSRDMMLNNVIIYDRNDYLKKNFKLFNPSTLTPNSKKSVILIANCIMY